MRELSKLAEIKDRYTALIFIAAKTILAMLFYGLILINMHLSWLSIEGNKIDSDIIIFLSVFFGIGIFVIISAFFKPAFYILSISDAALLILIVDFFGLRWNYILYNMTITLVVLFILGIFTAPEIAYYNARLRNLWTLRKVRK